MLHNINCLQQLFLQCLDPLREEAQHTLLQKIFQTIIACTPGCTICRTMYVQPPPTTTTAQCQSHCHTLLPDPLKIGQRVRTLMTFVSIHFAFRLCVRLLGE